MIYNTNMKGMIVILDTNVILAGLKSNAGISYQLIEKLMYDQYKIAVSVPLVMEYEAILKKKLVPHLYSEEDIDDVINYLCSIAIHTKIYYLWRPYLKDAFDDHVLEVAMSANVSYIVTYNIKNFEKASCMGITPIEPVAFLKMLEEG